jgi:hypothetical protein
MRIISALLALALATAGLFAATGTASAAEAPATRLALAVPLTVPPEATGLIAPESLQNYTSPTAPWMLLKARQWRSGSTRW